MAGYIANCLVTLAKPKEDSHKHFNHYTPHYGDITVSDHAICKTTRLELHIIVTTKELL